MKFFSKSKDGGPASTVTAYWLCEIKWLFSVALLKFENGSREEYHSHAFNSSSWLLTGKLREEMLTDDDIPFAAQMIEHRPGLRRIRTLRETFHRVFSEGTSWVLTFRGPWVPCWHEFDPRTNELSTLADGRVVLRRELV